MISKAMTNSKGYSFIVLSKKGRKGRAVSRSKGYLIVNLLVLGTLLLIAIAFIFPLVRGEIVKSKVKAVKPIHVQDYMLAKQKFPQLMQRIEANLARQGRKYPVIEWKHSMRSWASGEKGTRDPKAPGQQSSYYNIEPLVGE